MNKILMVLICMSLVACADVHFTQAPVDNNDAGFVEFYEGNNIEDTATDDVGTNTPNTSPTHQSHIVINVDENFANADGDVDDHMISTEIDAMVPVDTNPTTDCEPQLVIERTVPVDGTVTPGYEGLTVMAFTLTALCTDKEVSMMNFHIGARGYEDDDKVPFRHSVDGVNQEHFKNLKIIDPAEGKVLAGPVTQSNLTSQKEQFSLSDAFILTANVPRPLILQLDVSSDFQTDSLSTSYSVFVDGLAHSGVGRLSVIGGQTPAWGNFTVEATTCKPRYTIKKNGRASSNVVAGTSDLAILPFEITASNCRDIEIKYMSFSIYSTDGGLEDNLFCAEGGSIGGCPDGTWFFDNVRVTDGLTTALGPTNFRLTSTSIANIPPWVGTTTYGSTIVAPGETHSLNMVMNISTDTPIGASYTVYISKHGIFDPTTGFAIYGRYLPTDEPDSSTFTIIK